MKINHIWRRGFNSKDLRRVEYFFLVIIPRSTLTRICDTYSGHINESSRSQFKLFALHWNTWYYITLCTKTNSYETNRSIWKWVEFDKDTWNRYNFEKRLSLNWIINIRKTWNLKIIISHLKAYYYENKWSLKNRSNYSKAYNCFRKFQ